MKAYHKNAFFVQYRTKERVVETLSEFWTSFSKTMGYVKWDLSCPTYVPIQEDSTSCGIFFKGTRIGR